MTQEQGGTNDRVVITLDRLHHFSEEEDGAQVDANLRANAKAIPVGVLGQPPLDVKTPPTKQQIQEASVSNTASVAPTVAKKLRGYNPS
jgi:hypothetical protein